MNNRPVIYHNRYTGRTEEEKVCAGGWLRWLYGNALGRVIRRALFRRAVFSRLAGWWMRRPGSRTRIPYFISEYGIDAEEFEIPSEGFQCFNDFFIRRLKPGARPVDGSPASAVFPADGRHLGFQEVSETGRFPVKGEVLNTGQLLPDTAQAERYREGALVISRLCPADCHRFHFPAAGIPRPGKLADGAYDSVNPLALKGSWRIFTQNKRAWNIIQTERFGDILMMEIGAMAVGTIVQTYTPDTPAEKGAEKGYFQFGGSTILTLFEKGRVRLAGDLTEQTRRGRELYARMGDVMGSLHAE